MQSATPSTQLSGEDLAQGPSEPAPARGPVPSSGPTAPAAAQERFVRQRSSADCVARTVMRIQEPHTVGEQVYNVFSSSILLSATRCLLSYIVFPALGLVPGLFGHSFAHTLTASAIGLPIGIAALVSDVMAIRRFFRADHRWRWVAALLYLSIMGMVAYLVQQDLARLI